MIHSLRKYLEEKLESLEYVKAIFPAEIKHTKSSSSGFKVRFKYKTKTGAKLIAYAPGVV